MQSLTEDGQQMVATIASRHGVSSDAAYQLLSALAAGGGRQAQFNHQELGGMGQWSQGGMTMIGDMFNNGLKARVAALCSDLADALQRSAPFASRQSQSNGQFDDQGGNRLFASNIRGSRWPEELGTPASSGSQNDLHYAVFPGTHRLAIEKSGQVTVYDTGDHRIGGVSQQQSGDQSVQFTSQSGLVRLSDLTIVGDERQASDAPAAVSEQAVDYTSLGNAAAPDNQQAAHFGGSAMPPPAARNTTDDEIFSRLERLADLRSRDIITAEEFASKKAELLARL